MWGGVEVSRLSHLTKWHLCRGIGVVLLLIGVVYAKDEDFVNYILLCCMVDQPLQSLVFFLVLCFLCSALIE